MPSEEFTLSPPLNRSLADEIVIRLRAAILSGQFEPDERLGEQFLAETLGVSRGPIREALSKREESRVTYWLLDQKGVHGTRMFGKVKGIEERVMDWFKEFIIDGKAGDGG